MAYYLNLFSPETYEAFTNSDQTVSGFRIRHRNVARRINAGDKFICYLTKLSRWIGLLEVVDGPFVQDTPIFYPDNDPFVVRFRVRPLIWLPMEKAVPIHEDSVWNGLSFTRGQSKRSSSWTGKLRGSLVRLDQADGHTTLRSRRTETVDGRPEGANGVLLEPLFAGNVRGVHKLRSNRLWFSHSRQRTVKRPRARHDGSGSVHSRITKDLPIAAIGGEPGAAMIAGGNSTDADDCAIPVHLRLSSGSGLRISRVRAIAKLGRFRRITLSVPRFMVAFSVVAERTIFSPRIRRRSSTRMRTAGDEVGVKPTMPLARAEEA